MSSQEYYDYWYPIFSIDEAFKLEVDQYINKYNELKTQFETAEEGQAKEEAKKKCENFNKTLILAGKKISKDIRESADEFNSLRSRGVYSKLSPRQILEWDNIGSLVLTYGAASSPFLN